MVTAWQKEWNSLAKKEKAYLTQGVEKKISSLNKMLEEKVPKKLQETLDSAFTKAFGLVFEKGTDFIEKTYKRDEVERHFKVNSYALNLKEDKKSLRQFSKESKKAGQKNLLLSGIEGIGLGALGIGLPDIPLFVGVLLKSVYEIALHNGYSYESREEKYFILQIIKTSLSYGGELTQGDSQVNEFIENNCLQPEYSQEILVKDTAKTLSSELLYTKFLQGIPIVGAVGGMYNVVYLRKVQRYAKLKYLKRFLYDLKNKKQML